MWFRKKKKIMKYGYDSNENYSIKDIILPVYLNQRFVYDILATINGGFTEFYEIKDRDEDNKRVDGTVKSSIGTDNSFLLIKADIDASLNAETENSNQKEKNYKKTHTPTSLFMQVYQYLVDNKQIKMLSGTNDIDDISSGDFVEIKSSIKQNTMVELFYKMNKALDLTNVFIKFGNTNNNDKIVVNLNQNIKNVIKLIDSEDDKVKYGVCKIGDRQIALKLNKDYFINGDYTEINNGEFRIIGKVLEVIPENEKVSLNRDNIIGLYDTKIFEEVKEAAGNIANMKFEEFQDEIDGKTCVIMPIAIGI